MKKFFKIFLRVFLIIILCVVVIFGVVIGFGHVYRATYKNEIPATITRNDGGKNIIASGKGLYDENGNVFLSIIESLLIC